jgi:hypothetical protein
MSAEVFRAVHLIESDDGDAVLELAARILAARTGGSPTATSRR